MTPHDRRQRRHVVGARTIAQDSTRNVQYADLQRLVVVVNPHKHVYRIHACCSSGEIQIQPLAVCSSQEQQAFIPIYDIDQLFPRGAKDPSPTQNLKNFSETGPVNRCVYGFT
jgi:hypothetical protein